MFSQDLIDFNENYLHGPQDAFDPGDYLRKHRIESMNEFYLIIQAYYSGTNEILFIGDFCKKTLAEIQAPLQDPAFPGGYKDPTLFHVKLSQRNQSDNTDILFEVGNGETPLKNYSVINWTSTYPIALFIAILQTYNLTEIDAFYFSKGKSFNLLGDLKNTIVFVIVLRKADGTTEYHYYDYSQDPPSKP